MDIFSKIAERIIEQQEEIIGPIALEQAKKVQGLDVDWQKKEITFHGDKKEIIEQLVGQYQHLFGKASVEVCRDAVKGLVHNAPKDQIPTVLL